jgi:hypothetical protein
MAFDFPANPTPGATYSPAGGPTYVWDGSAWAISAASVMPPNDGGEYVMVNGAWRLSRQSFDLAGKTTQTMAVPVWGPTQARLTCYGYFGGTVTSLLLRASVDGTTFPSGASDYSYSGFVHSTGTNAFQNQVATNNTHWLLTYGSDNVTVPSTIDVVVNLARNSAGNASMRSRGCSYNNAAAALFQTAFMEGYLNATNFPGTTPLKGLLWISSAAAAVSGKLTVDWLP